VYCNFVCNSRDVVSQVNYRLIETTETYFKRPRTSYYTECSAKKHTVSRNSQHPQRTDSFEKIWLTKYEYRIRYGYDYDVLTQNLVNRGSMM
jgi:hypothetical protein